MKPIHKYLFTACLAFSLGNTAAEPLGQQFTFTSAGGTTWDIDWTGVSGRTYFIQWGLDLEIWTYAPVVEFETPVTPFGTNAEGVDKYFVRLRYVDADWVNSLQEAREADFDGDGIPNWYEVEELRSDPLDPDSNGGDSDADGMADGWEMWFFGNLTTADPNAVGQPDGLTNKEKSDLGLDPDVDYSEPNATQPSKYTYDLTGRLTGVTAPVAASNFTPDEEGNLLNAQ